MCNMQLNECLGTILVNPLPPSGFRALPAYQEEMPLPEFVGLRASEGCKCLGVYVIGSLTRVHELYAWWCRGKFVFDF